MSQPISTTLNRSWILKTGIFMVVLLVFGLWGLFDGVYLYPKRGLSDASFQLREYLAAADKAGQLTTSNITVADPKVARAELGAKERELRSQAIGDTYEARKAAMEMAKYAWLDSLWKAWRLNTDPKFLGTIGTKDAPKSLYFDLAKGEGFTSVAGSSQRATLTPQATLNELTNFWNTNNKTSPLSAYDMVFQWLFVAVGFGGFAWILLTILRSKATASKITFDADSQRLTLPGGVSLVPSDLTDIDKRKWNKFYCTLETAKGNHEVDLLRYEPLESWILEMEKTRFPERAAELEREKAEKERAEAEASNSAPANPNT